MHVHAGYTAVHWQQKKMSGSHCQVLQAACACSRHIVVLVLCGSSSSSYRRTALIPKATMQENLPTLAHQQNLQLCRTSSCVAYR
jgi:hypothetical protein